MTNYRALSSRFADIIKAMSFDESVRAAASCGISPHKLHEYASGSAFGLTTFNKLDMLRDRLGLTVEEAFVDRREIGRVERARLQALTDAERTDEANAKAYAMNVEALRRLEGPKKAPR